jgi:hypothetical protein
VRLRQNAALPLEIKQPSLPPSEHCVSLSLFGIKLGCGLRRFFLRYQYITETLFSQVLKLSIFESPSIWNATFNSFTLEGSDGYVRFT